MNKLTGKSVRYAITQLGRGRSTVIVAAEIGVTPRHLRRLWAAYRRTGTIPVSRPAGRPSSRPTGDQVRPVPDLHAEQPAGVGRTALAARKTADISDRLVYRIMKENGLVAPSPAKSGKRKWVRYERRYSNAMWHTDWHAMKEYRMRGMHLIAYLDDASRCVTGAGLFSKATSENAVLVLRNAVARFGAPATILSDNGSCFVGVRSDVPKKTWTPTLFEDDLLKMDIGLINSRPYHPQTNGKLERFRRTIEEEIWNYDSLDDYIAYYNERRLHWSLDIKNYQTPLKAFRDKTADELVRESNPSWTEEDVI